LVSKGGKQGHAQGTPCAVALLAAMRCHCKLFLGFGLALLSRLHRTWRLRWPLGAVLRHVHFIEVGKEAAFSSPWGSGAATALHSSKAPAAVLKFKCMLLPRRCRLKSGPWLGGAVAPFSSPGADPAATQGRAALRGGHALGQHTLCGCTRTGRRALTLL